MMKLELSNGTTVTVTESQYYTAKEWTWRTKEDGDYCRHPNEIFPARDNIDNGYRRCCRKLTEKNVLRGNPDIGYLLDTAVRYHMMREL